MPRAFNDPMDNLAVRIGLRVRNVRKDRRLATADVAAYLGISDQNYLRREKGLTAFRMGELVSLATAFGMSIDALLEVRAEIPETGAGAQRPDQARREEAEQFAAVFQAIADPDVRRAIRHVVNQLGNDAER